MGTKAKSVSDLTVQDLMRYPVWEYLYDDEMYPDESWVHPVKKIPVTSLESRIIGLEVRLANDELRWATFEDIDLQNETLEYQTLVFDIYDHGEWFPLATHGISYPRYGPRQFAEFLGLPVHDVFPIAFDYSHLVKCTNCCTNGLIFPPEIVISANRCK